MSANMQAAGLGTVPGIRDKVRWVLVATAVTIVIAFGFLMVRLWSPTATITPPAPPPAITKVEPPNQAPVGTGSYECQAVPGHLTVC